MPFLFAQVCGDHPLLVGCLGLAYIQPVVSCSTNSQQNIMRVTKEKKEKKGKKNTKLLAYLSFLRLLSPPKGILTTTISHSQLKRNSTPSLGSSTIVFCEGLFCLMRNIIDSLSNKHSCIHIINHIKYSIFLMKLTFSIHY